MSTTDIEWATHTANFWVGCDKISSECDHCYAAAFASRGMNATHKGTAKAGEWTGKINRASPKVWADARKLPAGSRVFTCSMSDFWHERVPLAWLDEALDVIESTSEVNWLVLSKRPGNIARKLRDLKRTLPANVWQGVTCGHRDNLKLVDVLRRVPATIRFLSIEPLLTPMIPGLNLDDIHWIITGGESGRGDRDCPVEWVRPIRDLCVSRDIAFFHKQWGKPKNNPLFAHLPPGMRGGPALVEALYQFDPSTKCPSNPFGVKGGALLDGKLWRQFPA